MPSNPFDSIFSRAEKILSKSRPGSAVRVLDDDDDDFRHLSPSSRSKSAAVARESIQPARDFSNLGGAAAAAAVSVPSAKSPPPGMSSSYPQHQPEDGDDSDEDFDAQQEAPEHVKGTRGIQMRNACVTYWPPFDRPIEDYAPFTGFEFASHILKPVHEHISFYVSALEVAPTTRRLHGHLYVEFTVPKTILQIKKILGNIGCRVFIRCGTQSQAVDYVFKRGKYEYKNYTQLSQWLSRFFTGVPNLSSLVPFVYGTQKQQGSRSDLDRYVEMAFQGVQRNEFLASEKGAGLRYFKYFNDACNVVDGLDRGDTIRANKRVLYEKYIDECEKRGEVPCRFFEFRCERDPKWNEESEAHYIQTSAMAIADREARDADERAGALNKTILDSKMAEEKEAGQDASDRDGSSNSSDSDE